MHLSIVIPTFNRADLYPQTIPALSNQKVDPGTTYEVIFVANGSTDATDSVLKEVVAADPEKFRYFWIEPTGGPSAPRNVGIRAATGDIIIILDDDVAPDPDLVMRHAEFHHHYPDEQHAAVGKVYVPAHLLDDPMSLFHEHYSYDRLRKAQRLSFFDFWTCNVSLKRHFMLAKGMFDESVLWVEDVEVAHRLESAGMHLHFLPAAQGQHLHQTNPSKLAAKAFAFGSWIYRITGRVPASMVRKRFGVISLEFGPRWFLGRLVRLAGFFILDNPLTRGVLRLLGATKPRRSGITDLYYGMVFNRAFLTGYYKTWLQDWLKPGGQG
jgi:glycosyltransferase involved in cell wall biosynthesis